MEQQLSLGKTVVDRNGAPLGTVARIYRESPRDSIIMEPIGGEVRFGRGYLEVAGAVPDIGQTLYIPFNEITDADPSGIQVNVHKAAVKNRDWNLRPSEIDEPQWYSEAPKPGG